MSGVKAVPTGIRRLHLDTNFLVFGMEPGHPARQQLLGWQGTDLQLAISALVWAEFCCGPVTPEQIRTWESALGDAIVPLNRDIAELGAQLFNLSGRRSRTLSDCLIAATAIQQGAKLATLNRADFEKLIPHGLELV